MHDLETKTTRTHEMREGELIVIRKEEGENGSGRFVSVTTEEKGITKKEVKEVLEEAVPRELEKVDKEASKLDDDIKNLEEEISQFAEDPEFKQFEEYIKGPKIKEFFDKLNKKDSLVKIQKQREFVEDRRKDILEWKAQFVEIDKTLKN